MLYVAIWYLSIRYIMFTYFRVFSAGMCEKKILIYFKVLPSSNAI